MNYKKAIKIVRASKGLSQKELSSLLKLSPSYISKIESGDRLPTLEIIEQLSKLLSVPVPLFMLLAAEKPDLKGIDKKTAQVLGNELLAIISSSKDE